MASSVGDLFIGLAGGRDVAAGKLGAPDDWAFTTHGRVWVNQNWLSHLLLYATWQVGGGWGLVALRAALVAALTALVAAACRRQGAAWPLAILVAAGVTLSCWTYASLRPNLVSLMLAAAVLWLLPASQRRTWVSWATAGLVWLWANSHGGFVYGLAAMGLWAACRTGWQWAACGRLGAALRTCWQCWAALGAAVALAGLANPFGLENLTHPLVVAQSEQWRQVPEWRPVWQSGYGRTVEFVAALVVLAVVGAWRGLAALAALRAGAHIKGGSRTPKPTADNREQRARAGGLAVYHGVLLAATLHMAFSSRRFVPLAMVVMAPLLAAGLQWAVQRRLAWLPWAMAAVLSLPAGWLMWANARIYSPDNPTMTGRDMFERMHFVGESFPSKLVEFMATNGIEGRLVCDWRWEGYIRWHCPGLKVSMGGRAQQAYDVAAWDFHRAALDPRRAVATLKSADVPLVALPGYTRGEAVMALLASGRWRPIFLDGYNIVLADTTSPQGASLAQRCLAGQLSYPDEFTAKATRAWVLSLGGAGAGPDEVLAAVAAANELTPCGVLYGALLPMAADPAARPLVFDYLAREQRRLESLPTDRPGAIAILNARRVLCDCMAQIYRASGSPLQAAQQASAAAALSEQITQTLRQNRNDPE